MSNNKKVLIIGFSSMILLIIFFAAIRLCFDFYIKAGPHRKSTRDVNTTDYSYATGCRIGEPWVVDGQWSLTILGVREVDYSYLKENTSDNLYKEEHLAVEDYYPDGKNPDVIYIMDYAYTNVDNAGVLGYTYPVGFETPPLIKKGESADYAQSVGVENPGDFTVTLKKRDTNQEWHEQTFKIDVPEN